MRGKTRKTKRLEEAEEAVSKTTVTMEDLRNRFGLVPCDEGGELCELYRDASVASVESVAPDEIVGPVGSAGSVAPIEGRARSGAIHYALAPGQRSEFHVLDCDEYWLFHAGSTVEVWVVGKDGSLRVEKLGLEADASPCLLMEKGEIFGARLLGSSGECAFMSCVTVPCFSYDGYRKLERDEMLETHPEVEAFYE